MRNGANYARMYRSNHGHRVDRGWLELAVEVARGSHWKVNVGGRKLRENSANGSPVPPDFLEGQKTGKTDRFHKTRREAWFKRWPEPIDPTLTAAIYELQLSRAIGKRKKQLVTWFLWNSKAARRSTASSGQNIFDASEKDKIVRVPRAVDAYQALYREKTHPAITKALGDAGEISRSNVSRSFVTFRQIVEGGEAEHKELKMKAKGKGSGVGDCHRSRDCHWRRPHDMWEGKVSDPQVRSDGENLACDRGWCAKSLRLPRAIQKLPHALNELITNASEATGWVFVVLAAGPNPLANGDIHSLEQYFGPKPRQAYFKGSCKVQRSRREAVLGTRKGHFFLSYSKTRALSSAELKVVDSQRRRDKKKPKSTASVSTDDESIPSVSDLDDLLPMPAPRFQHPVCAQIMTSRTTVYVSKWEKQDNMCAVFGVQGGIQGTPRKETNKLHLSSRRSRSPSP
ncbi:hypothetical protein Hypma_000428 [Hypsizygus marmoreus]|uniref:Uncharacterized protein n=1 Tax=Hypsizygus marmoreus TaxID=39966 RepID=A0A369JHM7_HYPMA|nr:hypothetical protein Hypma_000428 [Hypsizygus marmoreus]